MDLHFTRQAGPYGTGLGLVARWVAAGRRTLCVAGMALGDMDLHFMWQAWHLVTWTFTLRGRRGTYGTGLPLVARWVYLFKPGKG